MPTTPADIRAIDLAIISELDDVEIEDPDPDRVALARELRDFLSDVRRELHRRAAAAVLAYGVPSRA